MTLSFNKTSLTILLIIALLLLAISAVYGGYSLIAGLGDNFSGITPLLLGLFIFLILVVLPLALALRLFIKHKKKGPL
jgi:hypothetical protein